ncbi:MAG: PAS domain S-box protein, partial [Spirochaetes bacterium]|nr:PAS domain S-box protein [Spirochaetota bacterium]
MKKKNTNLWRARIADAMNMSRADLFMKFCREMMDNYRLKGAALAEKRGKSYTVCSTINLFDSNTDLAFTYSKPDSISFSKSEYDSCAKTCRFIPATDSSLILIISIDKRRKIDEREITLSIDFLSYISDFHRRQADFLVRYKNYLSIFMKSPNLTAILDRFGNVLEWNEIAGEMYGWDLKDGPISYADFVHDSDIPRIRALFTGLYRKADNYRKSIDPYRLQGDPEYREAVRAKIIQMGTNRGLTRLKNKSGERTYDVDYTVTFVVNPDSLEIDGFIVTTTDITKKNIMQGQLEESERKYRELFKLIPLFSMLIDTSGKTLEFNYVSEEDYGLDPRQDGISYMDFIHEEDRNRAASLFMDLYTRAVEIKNQWVADETISREECAQKLRSLRIMNEPLRLVAQRGDRVFETQFSASLWISETDLDIKGSLLSAIDVTERNNYRNKLEDSEKKYRELIEEKTKDIIFSLDERARFIMVNTNLMEKLGYPEEEAIGKNIVDILYTDPIDRNQINRETFLENLDRVLKERASDVRFKAVCDHKFLGEPVTLQFKLDPIVEDERVIGVMGFASEVSDDTLREYLCAETLSYSIENRLTVADEVSFRITRNLQKFVSPGNITLIRLGIREMIVNAIEHGNLGITYLDKSLAQKNQIYHELLRDRQMSEENRNKRVYIEYRLNDDRVEYTIRDEGNGFDYNKFFKLNVAEINKEMVQHGRGILITRSVFDEISYNEKGN